MEQRLELAMPACEYELAFAHHGAVAGVDEVGRGPLAGPVTAAAVILPADETVRAWLLARANDSKKMTEKLRAEVAAYVEEHCAFAVAEATVAEIDALNIRNAALLAMKRAVDALACKAVLVDGRDVVPGVMHPQKALIGGDGIELCIACASIVAKQRRDALMKKLDEQFPGYGWASNAGYGTATHMAGLQTLGVTEHHRRSFAPVRAIAMNGVVKAA